MTNEESQRLSLKNILLITLEELEVSELMSCSRIREQLIGRLEIPSITQHPAKEQKELARIAQFYEDSNGGWTQSLGARRDDCILFFKNYTTKLEVSHSNVSKSLSAIENGMNKMSLNDVRRDYLTTNKTIMLEEIRLLNYFQKVNARIQGAALKNLDQLQQARLVINSILRAAEEILDEKTYKQFNDRRKELDASMGLQEYASAKKPVPNDKQLLPVKNIMIGA